MENLFDVYGYCIIPKGTLLYRGHENESFEDCMFFATKDWVSKGFSSTLQIWKTIKEIKILFLVDYLSSESHAFSSLPSVYNTIFPLDSNPEYTDLDIKHWNISRRNQFVQRLFNEYKISGWFTSLENNTEVEICLFNKQANSEQLSLVEICKTDNDNYWKDSLQNLNLFPSKKFYIETENKLKTSYRNTYKLYRKSIQYCIKEGVENGGNKIHLKHSFFNLRTKLKI